MKKFLLLAAVAASAMTASAESFSDFFRLSFAPKDEAEKVITPGETVTVTSYYDFYAGAFPAGMESWQAQGVISATNIYDEPVDLGCSISCVDKESKLFSSCYEIVGGAGNCLSPNGEGFINFTNIPSLAPNGKIKIDVDLIDGDAIVNHKSIMLKVDMWVVEAGEKLEGSEATVYVNFTNMYDITAAVDAIETDTKAEYFNLLGQRVSEPQKGRVYLVRKSGKVSKVLF